MVSKLVELLDVHLRNHAAGTAEPVGSDHGVAHSFRCGRVVLLKGSTKRINTRRHKTDRWCDKLVHQDGMRVHEETVRQPTQRRKFLAFESAGHGRSFGEESSHIRPRMTDVLIDILH